MTSFQVSFRKSSERSAVPPNTSSNPEKLLSRDSSSSSESTKLSDALTCAFSYDSDLFCVGTSRGSVKLLHTLSNFKPASFELTSALCRGEAMNSAVSCIRFKPGHDRSTKDLLLCASTDGTLSEWHLGSVQMVFADVITKDSNSDDLYPNELYACDYEPNNGSFFCSTGKNGRIKVYDANRKAHISTLRYTVLSDTCDAHSSRVQAVKWSADDSNTIYSAGWDKTVQCWDVRSQKAVNRIYGPYICGDGLDCYGNMIVTASTRPDHNLQFWDSRNHLKPLFELQFPFTPSSNDDIEPSASSLFTCKFSPDGRFLAVGGSVDYRILDVKQSLLDREVVGKVKDDSAATEDLNDKNGSKKIDVLKASEAGRILVDGGVPSAVFSVAWKGNGMTAAVGYGNSIHVLNKFG